MKLMVNIMKRKAILHNEDGIALVVALVFLMVTLLIAGVVNRQAISEIVFARNETRDKRVLAMADSGTKDAIRWLADQTAPPETGLAKINGKSAFYKDDNGSPGNTYSWWTGTTTPPTVTGWSNFKYTDRPSGSSDTYRYFPNSDAGWTNYVYRDGLRYRYYIEHLPADYASQQGLGAGSSIKVGNKFDSSGGNNFKVYRITSVGSTPDNSVKKCIELNYAVKF